jgi:ribonuclease HI
MPGNLTSPPLVAVYADESCLGNGRAGDTPGGAGGLIEFATPQSGTLVRRDYWISEPNTTNNRMALRSVIEAARGLSSKGQPLRIVFTSDSRYLIDGLRKWVFAWAGRNWTRKGGAIENLALWQETLAALTEVDHEYDWRWVRGHAGHPQNEYANMLATRAAAGQNSSGGLVASAFDEWLDSLRHHTPPEPFPAETSFRPAPTPPRPETSALAALPGFGPGRRGHG